MQRVPLINHSMLTRVLTFVNMFILSYWGRSARVSAIECVILDGCTAAGHRTQACFSKVRTTPQLLSEALRVGKERATRVLVVASESNSRVGFRSPASTLTLVSSLVQR